MMAGFGAGLRRRWPTWLAVGGIAAAAVAAAAVTQPSALPAGESSARATYAALASAAIVAATVIPLAVKRRTGGRALATAIAAAALVLGLLTYLYATSVQRQCTVQVGSRSVLIGTELTQLGIDYRAKLPQATASDLVEDSPGDVERVWTRRSIARCRQLVSSTYFLWLPLLTVSLVSAVLAVPAGQLSIGSAAPARVAGPTPAAQRYDVFISYRHGGADADVARQLLDSLEADGYTVAIDARDFAPNATFLQEMERAIRESRYTIAIISERYLQSGHCEEEAIVTSVLDMADRRRRLIPLIIQQVEMPAWLFGLVGIDCTKHDALVDPIDKLKATLGAPLRAA
jgi:hypothetical protein